MLVRHGAFGPFDVTFTSARSFQGHERDVSLAILLVVWHIRAALPQRRSESHAQSWAILIAVTLTSNGTHAQMPPQRSSGGTKRFELTWEAPEGCPSHAEVAHEVEELISDTSETSRSMPIGASAYITQEPHRFVLVLTLREGEAERVRRIGAPTCQELAHAAALVVAIAVDPAILARRTAIVEPQTDPNAQATVPSEMHCRLSDLPVTSVDCPRRSPTVVAAPPETKTKAIENVALRWRLGLGAFVSHGILPGTQFGMSASGALQLARLRLIVVGSILTNRAEIVGTGRGGDFTLYRGSPSACWLLGTASWTIGPCSSLELGRISGQGYGDPTYRGESALWAASSAGGRFEMRLGSSAFITVAADVGIPWWRDEFRLNGLLLHQPSRLFVDFGASLAAGW